MSGKAVLDSNTIMDLFNGVIPLEAFKEALTDMEQIISVITELELLSFPRIGEEQETKIKLFLERREIVPLTEEIKKKTVEFRRKTHKKLPDSIIAATSIVSDATLITRDKELLTLNLPCFHTLSIAGDID
ncbi:MAG: type II toxin-antitoxin system VapC family toxin [Treponema sp.]|jgi:predicted nucleic acid-binding protein|nr:type II toxin-antitoxin system VapC family toxin [Treponema sp.]